MAADLTEAQKAALEKNQGILQGDSFVILSMERYKEVLGGISDEELAESVQFIKQAMQDIDDGKGVSMSVARQRIAEKHGL